MRKKPLQNLLLSLLFTAGALSAILSPQRAQAQNPNYNINDDLVLFFLRNATVDTDVVFVSLPSLTAMRNQVGTNAYTPIISGGNATSLNSTLSAAFGSGWAGLTTDLFVGAAGTRTNSVAMNSTYSSPFEGDTREPRSTIYFSQPRTSNDDPGLPKSPVYTIGTNGFVHSAATGIMAGAQNWLETLGTGFAVTSNQSAVTLDEQVPITGANSFSGVLPSVVSKLSSPFSFGAAGSDVILALDLYRMKPLSSLSPQNTLPGETARTSYFLGQVVLKNTGEVGFLTIPEPSTAGLIALGSIAGIFALRRRMKKQS